MEVDPAKSAGLILFLNIVCINCEYIIVAHTYPIHFGLSIGKQTETLGRKKDCRRIIRAEND